MEIILNRVIVENFRGIDYLDNTLCNGLNIVQGYNGVGKTTLLSAITWCLFGKLYDDRKSNIPLLPIFSSNEEEKTIASVIVYLNDKYVLKRTYDGDKATTYYGLVEENDKIELVECTISDFEKFISDTFVDIETLKTLMNLNYAISLNWKDLKNIVFDIIGEIKPTDVFKIKDFPNIKDSINLFGYSTLNEKYANDIKTYTKNIKEKEINLSTLEQLKFKYLNGISSEQSLLDRKEELEVQLANYEKKLEENKEIVQARQEKQKEIDEQNILLKSYKNDLTEAQKLHYEYSNLQVVNADSVRGAELMKLSEELSKTEIEIMQIDEKINFKHEKLEDVKQRAKEIKEQKIKIENNRCSCCGQLLPQSIVENMINKLKIEQKDKIQNCKNEYDLIKQEIAAFLSQKEKLKIQREEQFSLIERTKTTKFDKIDKYGEAAELRLKEYKSRINTAELEIKKIESNINILTKELNEMPQEEILPSIGLLNSELNEISEKLVSVNALKKVEEEISDLEKEVTNDKSDLAILNLKSEELRDYIKCFSSIVKDKVKSKFNIVEFITEEYTKEGKCNETFKISKDGVPFQELNTAMKIEVALDLLYGIQLSKDIKAPILVDNCESIIDLPIVNTQMIVAKCIVQDEKKIEIVQEEKLWERKVEEKKNKNL